jgi:hypothetical protein
MSTGKSSHFQNLPGAPCVVAQNQKLGTASGTHFHHNNHTFSLNVSFEV